jgi:ribose transport system substrate-binding protein
MFREKRREILLKNLKRIKKEFKMKRKLMLIVAAFAVISLIGSFAISSSKTAAGSGGKKRSDEPLVGFGMYFYQDQWWKDMKTAAEETAAKVGVKLNVADADGDAAKQVAQLEAFIGMGVKGIIYAPVEPEASQSVVAEAKEKGIAVINIESALNDRSNIDCWVQLDQYGFGTMLAEEAAKFIDKNYGGKGKAFLLVDLSNSVIKDRVRGFKDAFAELSPKSVIVDEQDAGSERAKALDTTLQVLTAHPDIAVIFGGNTEMGMGAANALATINADPAKVAVYTEGWGAEFYDALVNEPAYMKAYATGPSVPIAEISVSIMADHLLNGTPLNEIETVEMQLLTKDNIDEYKDSWFQ